MSRKLDSLPPDLRGAADGLIQAKFHPLEVTLSVDVTDLSYSLVKLQNAFATTYTTAQSATLAVGQMVTLM